MKLIDRTPLQNEEGKIGIVQRVQGTIKYGGSWYPDLGAQKFVISHLQRGLGKGFVVIRNQTLGASGIIVPLILVGPAGVFAIHVTHLRGQYQAKGDSWGTLIAESFKPAKINLLIRTQRLARALQAYIEHQEVILPQPVEPILMAANPGMQVESVSPLVRVIMADALERWAVSLSNSAPVLTVETAYQLADRIVDPRISKAKGVLEAKPIPNQDVAVEQAGEVADTSGAGEIIPNEETPLPFNAGDLGFAFEGDADETPSLNSVETSSSESVPAQVDAKKRYLGMTGSQLGFLGGLIAVWICVMVGFAIYISQSS